jgi:mobile rSAM pair MarR family regulator
MNMDTQGGFLITRIKQVGGRVFEHILAEKNIDAFNWAQGRILYVLWRNDGVPISTLSRETGLATTTLTSMLDRMEAANLIVRDRGDRDRRKVLIYLTEAARGLEREYNAVSEEISNIYYKGFTKAEIAQLEGYLERVLKNVEEAL